MKQWKNFIVGCVLILALSCLTACGTKNNNNGTGTNGTGTNGTGTDGVGVNDTTQDKRSSNDGVLDNIGNDIVDGVENIGNDVENGVHNATNGTGTNGTGTNGTGTNGTGTKAP